MLTAEQLNLSTDSRIQLCDIADAAWAYGDFVGSNDDYETADLMHYAAGVEDVLRFIVGDSEPSTDLVEILKRVI